MDSHAAQENELSARMQMVDRYIPKRIRSTIETEYYAKVGEQATLDRVIHDPEFLANPLGHVAAFSDHAVVHVRDVAMNIVQVLNTIHGVLIPKRSPVRFKFIKGAGVILAYNHDVGMRNFSAFGRAMHPEFAAQEIYSPIYDEIINLIWEENSGNLAWYLTKLCESADLSTDPKLVLREVMALSIGHSKSKVPMQALNNPGEFRAVMVESVGTELTYLYHKQIFAKAKKKLAKAEKKGLPAEKMAAIKQACEEAQSALQTHIENHIPADLLNHQARKFYPDYEKEAFIWMVSDHQDVQKMAVDLVDTIRALRVADALRQRGTNLKTSAGYQILVDQNTANAIIAFQKGTGETFLLESTGAISSGEANIASGELTASGDLRVSFARGSFIDRETAVKGAHNVAIIIDDIQRDIIATFERGGEHGDFKDNEDIQILVEETDDNLEFGELVLEALHEIQPALKEKSRIVPSLKNVAPAERKRYIAAPLFDWSLEERKKLLVRIAQSGHQVDEIDPEVAFQDVHVAAVREGETLLDAGDPPGFVYIPLDSGLISTPLGGYQSFDVRPWIPIGNTRVIRGAPQEATVIAQEDVTVLMIPKEIYLKHWHDTYTLKEFIEAIPQLYAEDETERYRQILVILEQVAMIDAQLDEAELAFIQKFSDNWNLGIDTAELRAEIERGGRTDFVELRTSAHNYLLGKPPFPQVVQLRDMLNLFVKIDDSISEEEHLILSELMGLLGSYLSEDGNLREYWVVIVPQSPEQDISLSSLFPEFPKVQVSGGQAYLAGSYYSTEYSHMIAERYQNLNFFCTVEDAIPLGLKHENLT